ncbi:MATE family efflux transporter [Bacillus lacus]|uniref:Probable multidrug resistance protein NorM n=1 Tax=Metabacillus lacus TaxID=1983721 RepID=A0A7X2IZZ2_9BACI|nr:MATE family efflux transporter [Metabacillus lacus]MRX72918.1 MATE family efflux transporter [Metabacillus lacus]
MKKTNTLKEKLKQFSFILIPIFITQLGLFSVSFLDITMSGNVSKHDLAGVAIGSNLWIPIYTGLSGILLSITPIVAQLAGAQKRNQVTSSVFQGLYLSAAIAIVIVIVGYLSLNPILNNLNLESEVERIARQYLFALSFGVFPLFFYTVLRCFIDALGFTRVTMIITLMSLPINFVLNYLFIFGGFGFPRLGAVGAGVASAITYWCIAAIAVYIVIKKVPFQSFQIFSKLFKVDLSKWKEILLVGLPIGLAIFFETSIFAAVTLLMSNFDTVTIASHQAAINFASFLYMLPLSISMGLTIVVGYEIGAKRPRDAKEYSYLGIACGIILAVISAGIIYFLRPQIASLYTGDREVFIMTQAFLIYAIFFQLSDAIAAPIQGALRGYKDVNVAFIMALVSYWVIGLPIGYFLGTYTELAAYGYWVGLIAGLAAGAIGLSARLLTIQKRAALLLESK